MVKQTGSDQYATRDNKVVIISETKLVMNKNKSYKVGRIFIVEQ